jgi:hypothetical protein
VIVPEEPIQALPKHTAVLPALYTRVLLPPAVVRELRDAEAPEAVRAWTANLPTWCEVRRPAPQLGQEKTHVASMKAVAVMPSGKAVKVGCAPRAVGTKEHLGIKGMLGLRCRW